MRPDGRHPVAWPWNKNCNFTQKAELEGIEIPHDVITLVASSITTNIREIEGAYTKIVAYAGLMNMPITVELARNILDEMGATVQSRQITYEAINEATAAYFKIKPDELFTKNVPKALPRQGILPCISAASW